MWVHMKIVSLLLIKVIATGEVGDRCTPNEFTSNGSCTVITECEVALRAIRNTNSHPFRRCGFKEIYEVICCPDSTNLPTNTVTTTRRIETATMKTTTPHAIDKYGDIQPKRIADRECRKHVEGNVPPIDTHIIGGVEASLGEFPHMVALGYEIKDYYDFLCGGSLISNTYIVTAGHCVETLDGTKPTIARMGTVYIGAKEFDEKTDIKIAEIITHPNYTRSTKYHDLALIRLTRPVVFDVNVSSVCLYTSTSDPVAPLTITGWGKTTVIKDSRSEQLLKANVTVVEVNKCRQSYTGWRRLPSGISNEQICAGDPKGLRDTCQGDSGGPLQGLTEKDGHYRLVGVTSFGRGCGTPVPGVYTRIAYYLDWIESVVWP